MKAQIHLFFSQLYLRWLAFRISLQLASILRLPYYEAIQWVTQMRFYAVTCCDPGIVVDAYVTALDNLELAVKRRAGITQ